MTNRDYLMGLDNKELAKVMVGENICDDLIEKCLDCNCTKCIAKWLEKERKSDVEKWQIRRDSYEGCFWLILYVDEKSNWCIAVDEHGHISKMATSVVCTWAVWNIENKGNAIDKFLERIFENL